MITLQRSFREIRRYPSAVVGLGIIALLIALSMYAVLAIPYSEASRMWRGGEEIWYQNPKTVPPEWVNVFRRDKLPKTVVMSSKDAGQDDLVTKTVVPKVDGSTVTITFLLDYAYDAFPQELILYFDAQYAEKLPFASVAWVTPDGREIRVGDFSVEPATTYRFSQDSKLQRRLKGQSPEKGLFMADPTAEKAVPIKGTYTLRIDGITFEEGSDLDAEFVMHGQVAGIAGTDHLRRDLEVALLWGTPVALAFGLLAALGTTITTMIIAAIGVWFGGWVDEVIQRITEVSLVLPLLPILIMVGTFYSRSIWVILGVTILLSIFGGAIKTYRAVFLQVKESPYIEAARAYGASNVRIIFTYLIPRIIPMLIPQLVILIPSFVFLEASLAVLGLGDPILPTWGKIIDDARSNGALYKGLYYWILEPAVLLMVTGLAFAMLGFSLDRIFNPRLRGL
jgi:peptide/nickel transport system permease protein